MGEFYTSPPDPPLYAVDGPDELRVRLALGGVDRRHYRALHPALAGRGVTRPHWHALLREVDAAPRVGWPAFAPQFWASPRPWLLAALAAVPFALQGLGVVRRHSGGKPPSALSLTAALVYLTAYLACGVVVWGVAWAERDFDADGINLILERHGPLLRKLGASLEYVTDGGAPALELGLPIKS